MENKEINKLLDERDDILNKEFGDSAWVRLCNKKVDAIQKKITDAIRENFDKYEVDFIVETWTRFGASPNIIYDDNGLFAVTQSGFQQVVTGKQKIEGSFVLIVQKKQWKKTIREALKYNLFLSK